MRLGLLWASLVGLCALRLYYPFFNPPLRNMAGMSGRQWKQAGSFLDPEPMAGVDSFLYQAWLWAVRSISGDHQIGIQLACGLLCAAVPLCWYLCARQLMPAVWALVAAIIIALHPSFLTIYAYFASETLLLPLIGLACWASLRCYRMPDTRWFWLAAVFWTLASLTRYIAFPPALLCLGLLWWKLGFRLRPLLLAGVSSAILLGISAEHHYKAIKVYTPFGMPEMNALMARSDAGRIHIYFDGKFQWFRSPAFSTLPLMPLSDWRIGERGQPAVAHINMQQGRTSWDAILEPYPFDQSHYLRHMSQTVVMLLFAPSWPEVWPHNWSSERITTRIEEMLNLQSRWLWAPLILFTFIAAGRVRLHEHQRAFVQLTLTLIIIMALQYTAIFEGRYRKPVEPMLIVSTLCLLYQYTKRQQETDTDAA